METLEIRNPEEVRYLFNSIPTRVRTFPSLIMLAFGFGGIVIFLANICTFFSVCVAGWIVAEPLNQKNRNSLSQNEEHIQVSSYSTQETSNIVKTDQ